MRTTIRGLSVELSVDEFKQLTSEIVDKTYNEDIDDDVSDDSDDSDECDLPHATLPKIQHRTAKSSYKKWNKSHLKLLRQHRNDSMSKLLSMFKGRSYDSIKCQLFKIHHGNKYSLNPNNRNIPRFKYLNARANTLMKKDDMKRSDALRQASKEWNLVEKVRQ